MTLHLKENGVTDNQILEMNFESHAYKNMNSDSFYELSLIHIYNFDIDFPVPYFVISHCSTLLKKPYTLGVAFERRLLTAACALTI